MAATGFIDFAGSHDNTFFGCGHAIGIVRLSSATHADSMHLGNIFGNGQQLGNRLKRDTPIIHIESRDDHALTAICKILHDINKIIAKELRLVYPDHLCKNSMLKDLLKEKEINEDEERNGEEAIQKLTDRYIAEVEKLLKAKEEDLMAV